MFPGPWGDSQGEGTPLWGWMRDEETLLLLNQTESELETVDTERVITGPWNVTAVNPFEENLWLPLREPLLEQETQTREHVKVGTSLVELIDDTNPFCKTESGDLFKKREAHIHEPSDISRL